MIKNSCCLSLHLLRRPLPAVFMIALFGATVPAPGQLTVVENQGDGPTIYRMVVSPAPAPEPAFRYRLFKHEDDCKDGNAVTYYYRAMLDSNRMRKAILEKFGEQYDQWYNVQEVPLDQLPKDKVHKALALFDGTVMRSLREATSRRRCEWDWRLDDIHDFSVFEFLLPELQNFRAIARMLLLRARLAIAEGRTRAAITSLQMIYRMGRDGAEPPLLVCGLVGLSIAGTGNTGTLELMAAPDSPNLYWALADMPKPMIDLRRAAHYELGIGLRVLPLLREAETAEYSPAEWSRRIGQMLKSIRTFGTASAPGSDRLPPPFDGPGWKSATSQLAGTVLGLLTYPQAKKSLISDGMSPREVDAMPVGQVLVLASARAYRHTSQQLETLWCIPFSEMKQRERAVTDHLKRKGYLGTQLFRSKEIIPIASLVLPAISAARVAQARLARDLAAMQLIEALRMHAAETGQLPASLDDVKVVPVPINPATEKPFVYHTESSTDGRITAILELPKSDGVRDGRRYEITLRSRKER